MLKGAIGGGPSASANVQAGKTNTQTIGTTQIHEQRLDNVNADTITQIADDTQVKADRVERIVVNQRIPVWIWFLLIVAWLLDSPRRYWDQIKVGFRRRRERHAARGAAGR